MVRLNSGCLEAEKAERAAENAERAGGAPVVRLSLSPLILAVGTDEGGGGAWPPSPWLRLYLYAHIVMDADPNAHVSLEVAFGQISGVVKM